VSHLGVSLAQSSCGDKATIKEFPGQMLACLHAIALCRASAKMAKVLTMTTLSSFKNSPHPAVSSKPSEIEMMAVREDSASVHAGRAFSQANLADRYQESMQGSETPLALVASLAAAPPSPHAPICAGSLTARLAVANGLRKRRAALLAEQKSLNEKITMFKKLDVSASRLWEEYATQASLFKHQFAWGSVCTLSLVGSFFGVLFFKEAYDARTNMNVLRQVLEAGGPRTMLDTLQAKLDQTIQDLQNTTDNLDNA
jgi:hypothetical protein